MDTGPQRLSSRVTIKLLILREYYRLTSEEGGVKDACPDHAPFVISEIGSGNECNKQGVIYLTPLK